LLRADLMLAPPNRLSVAPATNGWDFNVVRCAHFGAPTPQRPMSVMPVSARVVRLSVHAVVGRFLLSNQANQVRFEGNRVCVGAPVAVNK